jgi:hypothetical protein
MDGSSDRLALGRGAILATMTGPVDWRPMEKMAGYALTSDSNGDAW